MVVYKQLCMFCKKNMVLIVGNRQRAICADCQWEDINKPIKDKEMKQFFDLPEDLYRKSAFLRNIKQYYLNFGQLTEKQKEAFQKEAARQKEEKPKIDVSKIELMEDPRELYLRKRKKKSK